MPFITQENRHKTDAIGPVEVGDRCFLAYREMLRRWRKSRRWTTAHEIYKDVLTNTMQYQKAGVFDADDILTANQLAWQVFFHRHVMIYENEKAAINGEVDTDDRP